MSTHAHADSTSRHPELGYDPARTAGHRPHTDPTGRMRSGLPSASTARPSPSMPSLDRRMSPVSWNAWLTEFDRRQLALKVISDNEFELIERKNLN